MAALASPAAHAAATITVINNDGAGEGFNDPTPAAPVGGNTGTTIGQQRLIAFQYAANIWAARITSSVTIRVGAQFDPLTCNASGAILGSAGPNTVHRDFAGAPVAGTWYAAALANALSGTDLSPGTDDINATFNSTIGTTCAFPNGWYYGLDGSPPGSQIDFVSVLVHEMGHGLGFLSLVNLGTGAKFNGFNDAYMRHLENHGASPADYPSMSDAQRVAASTATGNLHWTGANVRAAGGFLTAGKVGDHVRMYAPNPAQSGSSVSHWDTALSPNQVMEPSYTQPLHNPALELALFKDIGWNVVTQSLTVTKTGTGTVTSTPAGIDCGGTCSANFNTGVQVTLTATPGAGWTFAGWGGACSGTGSCVVTMNSAQSVSATFTQPTFSLTVSKNGSGTVTSSPAGINCGATCSANFASGTSVTLTPTPASGWVFTSWSGACSGSGGCTVTMDSAKSVTATFTQQSFTVAVSKVGNGTVTSTPAGINCGATCSANFSSGTSLTLTATPANGFVFVSWTEGANVVSTSASYNFTVSSGRTLVAHFSAGTFVNARGGTDTGFCPAAAPCATLNYALSVTDAGATVTIIGAGTFGPVVLNKAVTIVGPEGTPALIVANPAAQVGCVGALPAGCGLTNHGYAVEVAAGTSDTVRLAHLTLEAGSNGSGALKIASGDVVDVTYGVFRGNNTATGPVVSITPGGSAQTQVYMSHGEISSNKNGGGVLVAPTGSAISKLHFNHMEVHHTMFGIKTDVTGLGGGGGIATFVSDAEFFSFTGSAVTALSSAGSGLLNSVYNNVNILNTGGPAVNANGPNSVVILTNGTLGGNQTGVSVANGATVFTSINNTIKGNAVDVNGVMTASPRK